MLGVRDVSIETIQISNLCFIAAISMLISGQLEMIRVDSSSYTVYCAYCKSALNSVHNPVAIDRSIELFYAGYGPAFIPFFGVTDAYDGMYHRVL